MGQVRSGPLALAAAVVASVVIAAAALAAPGDFVPRGCVDDNDPGQGPDACGQSADGLNGAVSVALSADGTSLYAASILDDAIVHFARDPAAGALTPIGCVDDNDPGGGSENCAQSTDGLRGARSVAVSPDGESVYAVSVLDNAVVRFDRDSSSGALTPLDCVDDVQSGPEATCSNANGLGTPQSIVVSPDGKSIYVASNADGAIVRIDRDLGNGSFGANSCIDDADPAEGPDDCGMGNSTDGLAGAFSVTVSPDGKSVYAASRADDAIVSFDRGAAAGALTAAGCIDDDDDGPETSCATTDGLSGATSAAVAPDGSSVYAASVDDDAIVSLDRDASSGALSNPSCVDDNDTGVDDCAQSTDGLDAAFSAAVSPDGNSVYAASFVDDAIVRLNRDPTSGALTPQSCIDDDDDPAGPDDCAQSADGLDLAVSVAASPDGSSLYATSQDDDAIVHLGFEPADTDPPETEITKGPKKKTRKRKAKLKFRSDEPGSTFECKLDKRDFAPCDSPKKYKKKKLRPGRHSFKVRATDAAGNTDSTPAKRRWKVRSK